MKLANKIMLLGTALLTLSAYSIAAPTSAAEPVIVTGKKAPEALSDQEVTKGVEAALNSDPYVYAKHVSVTTTDGVVTLQGLVADESDLLGAIRISSAVAGVKRVVDELEIWDFGRS